MEQMKTCSKCGEKKPATAEYFSFHKGKLRAACKECQQAYNREWRAKNREHVSEYNKNRWENDPEYWREYKHQYYLRNRERILARDNKRYADNIEDEREKARRNYHHYKAENPEKVREKERRYRENHREERRESSRKHDRNNPDKVRERSRKRRSKRANFPHNFTSENEAFALNYWNGRCAICERPLNDLFGEHVAAMDHWIPLANPDCPGTIPSNIVPLCHGIGGCNNKKRDRDPIEWLHSEFSDQKAKQILERIEAFFKLTTICK